MSKIKVAMIVSTAALLGACSQNMPGGYASWPPDIPVAYAGGPPDPNSETVFNLSLVSGSLPGCWQANPVLERPMTIRVQDNSGELLTSGGVHSGLTRVAPNTYAGALGNYLKIGADLATTPKTLRVRNNGISCVWTATAS